MLSRTKAIKNAEAQGIELFRESMLFFMTGHRVLLLVKQIRVIAPALRHHGGHLITEIETDEYTGKRIAKYFDNILFFGTSVERIRGAVLADQPTDSRKVL
jgi:hypothetical protein